MTAMIGLFPTCLGDAVHPRVVRDASRVLAAAGVSPAPITGATCCGQPAWNGGFVADARRVARRTLRAVAELDAVVVPSGSCAAMMRLHWPQLFADDRDAALAGRVAARVFELSQYLVEELGAPPIGSHTGRPVAYHDSCHMLRELRLHDPPRRLLLGRRRPARVAAQRPLLRLRRRLRRPLPGRVDRDGRRQAGDARGRRARRRSSAPTPAASCKSRAAPRAPGRPSGSSTWRACWRTLCERVRAAVGGRAGRPGTARECAPLLRAGATTIARHRSGLSTSRRCVTRASGSGRGRSPTCPH